MNGILSPIPASGFSPNGYILTKLRILKTKRFWIAGVGGDHLKIIVPYCKKATGIDLNSAKAAARKTRHHKNIDVMSGDIATLRLDKTFDIVYSIGVLHHTDDPSKTFDNIKNFVKPGGRLIIWVYSYEGNFLNRTVLEFLKRNIFLKLNKNTLHKLSKIITSFMYAPIYTVYLLPLRFLPFYEYFQNWRRLNFYKNNLNVFDKLNASRTHYIQRSTVEEWFNPKEFKNTHVSPYKGVSWRASGTRI